MNEYVKGQNRLYLCALLKLAQNGHRTIGEDKGAVGQQHKHRSFFISEHEGQKYLKETKSSAGMADFTRSFEIRGTTEQPEFIFIENWTH